MLSFALADPNQAGKRMKKINKNFIGKACLSSLCTQKPNKSASTLAAANRKQAVTRLCDRVLHGGKRLSVADSNIDALQHPNTCRAFGCAFTRCAYCQGKRATERTTATPWHQAELIHDPCLATTQCSPTAIPNKPVISIGT